MYKKSPQIVSRQLDQFSQSERTLRNHYLEECALISLGVEIIHRVIFFLHTSFLFLRLPPFFLFFLVPPPPLVPPG